MIERDADRGTAQLIALLVLTGVCLTVSEWVLSANTAMTVAALRIGGVALLAIGTACLSGRFTGSAPAGVLAALACLLSALAIGPWVIVPLVAASGLLLRLVGWRAIAAPLANPGVWLGAVLAAAVILPIPHLADFLIVDKLHQGAAHQDALFHASVVGMVKTYGQSSVGLNGVVPLPYHVLSHQLLAAVSILAGVPVLETVGIAGIVVLGPLLLFALAWCARALAEGTAAPSAVTTWLVVCTVFAALEWLPIERGGGDYSYFVSESYTLALALLVLALPLIARRDSTTASDVLAAVLLVVAGMTKGNIGLIGLGLMVVRILWFPGAAGRTRPLAIAALATLVFAWVMAGAAESAGSRMVFRPFHIAQTYTPWGSDIGRAIEALSAGTVPAIGTGGRALAAIAMFLLCHLLVSFVVLGRRWWVSGWRGLTSHPDAVLSLAAIVPGLAVAQFRMAGGSYFLNQTLFVSLPFAALWLARRLDASRTLARRAVTTAALVAAAMLVVQSYRDQPFGPVFVKHHGYVDRLNDRGRGGHVDALLALRPQRRDRPVIFVAAPSFPKPADVWDCYQVPFTYPAVTERAWLELIDAASGCRYISYGYQDYFVQGTRLLKPAAIPPGVTVVPVGAGGAQ